jgi:molecular chaperone HscC
MLTQNNTGIMNITYNQITYEYKIDRKEFEQFCSDLILRLRHPIERALRDAELRPANLDAAILIGGATRMPLIKTVVGRMFGKLPYTNINPDEAVALGAAIQVALKERNELLKEVILTDVCPYTLGTEVAKEINNGKYQEGYFLPIIERNTPIPVSRVNRLTTIRDYQSKMELDIYQGENRLIKDNIKLGELEIGIRPDKAGEESIDVRFTYDINGLLEVEVTIVNTGEKKSLVIEKNKGTMTPQEIEERLKVLQELKIHPRDKMENKLLLVRGERLYQEALGEKREFIGDLLNMFDNVLSTQNEIEIKKAAKKLREHLEVMEGWNDYE